MSTRTLLAVIGVILLVLASLPLPIPMRLEWLGWAFIAAAFFLT